MERAEERLGAGGTEELRERVRQTREVLERVRKDQHMVPRRLEEGRIQLAAPPSDGTDGFDRAGADRLYRAAFTEYGIDLWDGPANKAADRIASSQIRERLLVGLDDWGFVLRNTNAAVTELREIANKADDDGWHRTADRVRARIGRR